MIRVCPKPPIWASIDKKLTEFSGTHVCSPPTPPKPLILAGWAYSTNKQKHDRWQETIDWAKRNSCADIVNVVSPDDYYCVSKMTL